jgi:hypothetical protein
MESIYQSRGYVACLKQGFTFVLANPLKMLKVMWVWILISSVCDVALYGTAKGSLVALMNRDLTTTIWSGIIFFGIILFLLLLSIFVMMYFGRYMIRLEEKKYKVKKGKLILRNFWSLLGILMMAGFLSSLLSVIPYMPIEISNIAYTNYIASDMLYNDTVSIPTSGYVALFVMSVASIAVCEFISLVVPASLMYKYGSIVYNEQNK